MEQPQGLQVPGQEHLVCHLLKSLYGLKQAPRAWHLALITHLIDEGYSSLQCESCVLVKVTKTDKEIIGVYVDDLVLVAKLKTSIARMRVSIARVFKAKVLGDIHFILGMVITRDRVQRKLWISQQPNAEEIVKKFNMGHARPVNTPSVSGNKLHKLELQQSGDVMADMACKPFRQAVGSLMYLMIGSRPDLGYSIQNVSQFLNAYGKPHWQAVKQIIQYVKRRRHSVSSLEEKR